MRYHIAVIEYPITDVTCASLIQRVDEEDGRPKLVLTRDLDNAQRFGLEADAVCRWLASFMKSPSHYSFNRINAIPTPEGNDDGSHYRKL